MELDWKILNKYLRHKKYLYIRVFSFDFFHSKIFSHEIYLLSQNNFYLPPVV